jgi:hypothetical protein
VDTATGAALPWNPNANGIVHALLPDGDRVIAGGAFTQINSMARNRIAAIDTSGALLDWNPDASGTVTGLARAHDRVYAAGSFNTIGGAGRNFVAALDAASGGAQAWSPDPSVTADEVLPFGARVTIGGSFTQVGATPRSRLAVVDSATGAVQAWNAGLDFGSVNALAASPGMLYVGGEFRSIGGVPRTNLAAVTDPALTVSAAPWAPRGPRASLAAPSPQPLRDHGSIAFDLPRPDRAELALFDVAGRRVRTLLEPTACAAGRHVARLDAEGLAPGVYLARLRTGSSGERSRRVVVLGR